MSRPVLAVFGNKNYPTTVTGTTNEYFEVLSGLNEGDTVVTSGQNNLVDNTRVVAVAAE